MNFASTVFGRDSFNRRHQNETYNGNKTDNPAQKDDDDDDDNDKNGRNYRDKDIEKSSLIVNGGKNIRKKKKKKKNMTAKSITDASGRDPLVSAVEIIKDRLYYAAFKSVPSSSRHSAIHQPTGKPIVYFQIDTELVYWNFFLDFGPLNLGQLYRFSTKLNSLLKKKRDHVVCFYSSTVSTKRANAVYLICAWQLLYLDRTPEEAYRGFKSILNTSAATSSAARKKRNLKGTEPMEVEEAEEEDTTTATTASSSTTTTTTTTSQNPNQSAPPRQPNSSTLAALPPFHDASPCNCTYDLTILDCLRGLAKARMYRFFDFRSFDVREYEFYEQVENGDLNWIIKDRILAFAGPQSKRNVSPEGYCALTPNDYIPYFQKHKVGLVIRLNKKCYDESDFTKVGISHMDQYYLDGSCPPMSILQKVVHQMEQVPSNQAFAVHCKAGLGRTGTCIGAYMMKHYKFTAPEAIAWMRICRPGMVIGPQQHFLQDIEQRMWHEGNVMKLKPPHRPSFTTTTSAATTTAAAAASPKPATTPSDSKRKKKKPEKPSPNSVTQTSHLFSAPPSPRSSPPKPEDATGRVGQAEGLLARRHQNQNTTSPRRLFE